MLNYSIIKKIFLFTKTDEKQNLDFMNIYLRFRYNMKHLLMSWIILTLESFLLVQAQEEGTFTDTRDGHVYRWIKIGKQTWMAENLAYLPHVNRVSESQFDDKCFYVYGYDENNIPKAKSDPNYKKYGVLYNWEAAKESCPKGWHLPTDREWMELEKHLGMDAKKAEDRDWRGSGDVGQKLKSASGWNMNSGTDETGFHALPGGCRGYEGFGSEGFCAYFWTASPAGGDNGWRRGFCGDDNGSFREEERGYFGLSVRCVKDE
jgi:uncharacterized protein (TIGR02145 family)